jgi:hypothetical protein
MTKKTMTLSLLAVVFVVPLFLAAQEAEVVKLPAPQMTGGKPLLDCLRLRQSARDFSPEKLSPQVLSNLLWAADGINRPESGKRTAPSAMNVQDIEIYAATADGLFLYMPKENALKKILAEDVRGITGKQDFVKVAPLDLVYVSDWAKMSRGTDNDRLLYSGAHTGFVSQNVYLFCAAEGLNTVVRAMIDREAAVKVMKLRPEEHITLSQTVGYPKK